MQRFIILLFVLLTGCGGGKPAANTPVPTDQISNLVSSLPDSAANAEKFNKLFAAGAAPNDTDRAKYRPLMLRTKSAKVDGQTGTVTVTVEDMDGKVLGEKEWTLVQEGAEWKVKSAPLP